MMFAVLTPLLVSIFLKIPYPILEKPEMYALAAFWTFSFSGPSRSSTFAGIILLAVLIFGPVCWAVTGSRPSKTLAAAASRSLIGRVSIFWTAFLATASIECCFADLLAMAAYELFVDFFYRWRGCGWCCSLFVFLFLRRWWELCGFDEADHCS